MPPRMSRYDQTVGSSKPFDRALAGSTSSAARQNATDGPMSSETLTLVSAGAAVQSQSCGPTSPDPSSTALPTADAISSTVSTAQTSISPPGPRALVGASSPPPS